MANTKTRPAAAVLFPLLLLAAASLPGLPACSRLDAPAARRPLIEVDFLEPLGLTANALAPQVVCADPARNRVFAACANSSAVAVINGLPTAGAPQRKGSFTIPVDSRMPRRLRGAGIRVSQESGWLYLCGESRLIIVDPVERSSRSVPLPADFEALDLDSAGERAYLAGRASGDLAVVDGRTGEVTLVPYGEPAPPLPFRAASAPPAIRIPVVDAGRGRVHVVDGAASTLHTFDARENRLLGSRTLDAAGFPRWHVAGFCPQPGRILVLLENDRREAVSALAIDAQGGSDAVLPIPEGFSEPAGVSCDPERQELYIPYDNNKAIHVAAFGDKPEVATIELPSMGVDASAFDPATRTLYGAGWMQAALYAVDMDARKLRLTVPFAPVYPHMNSLAFNGGDGCVYFSSGSTAVNGTFGAAITRFDPATLGFAAVRTGWGPVALVPKPGSESFIVLDAEGDLAEVAPDGSFSVRPALRAYPRQAMLSPDRESILVAYGPHSSMWPTFYIGGTRDGILRLAADFSVLEDRLTPRLVQGMLHDAAGRLWFLQNTWGKEAPFLVCHSGDGEGWCDLRLPPEVDNECALRLLAINEKNGLVYACRTGDLNTDAGMLYVIDPEAREVRKALTTGRTPADLLILPEEDALYVANFDDGTLTRADTNGEDATTLPAGRGPLVLGSHRASRTVYVLNHLDASLTILSPEGVRTQALPAGALPDNLLVEQGTGQVFITAHGRDEARVYWYDPDETSLTQLAAARHPLGEVTFDQSNAAFQERAQWGDGIFRITSMTLDGEARLWVADYLSGKLFILDWLVGARRAAAEPRAAAQAAH